MTWTRTHCQIWKTPKGWHSDPTYNVQVIVKKAEKCKCPRCWRFVAEEPEDLCERCEEVVQEGACGESLIADVVREVIDK